MASDIKSVIENTKGIYMSESALQMLMDFERVIDEMNLYAFENWKTGELVRGPDIGKYRVSCTFMWPLTKMPDPAGAERLLAFGAKIKWGKDWLLYPVKIKNPDDFIPGTKKAKMARTPIWLVDINLPKSLLKDIQKGSTEIMDQDIDLGEVEDAYEQGLDNEGIAPNEGMENAAPVAAPAV